MKFLLAFLKKVWYYNQAVKKMGKQKNIICGCGGTGRRAGLKIQLW